MVPAIHLLVDTHEHLPYEFRARAPSPEPNARPCRRVIMRSPKPRMCSAWNAGGRKSSTRSSRILPTIVRDFCGNLEPLLAIPHRFLVIEGAIQYTTGGGRLAQYHKNGMVDFLDALTARYGMHIIHADSREEAEERVANLAALHYAYHLAEQQGLGRCLTENDA